MIRKTDGAGNSGLEPDMALLRAAPSLLHNILPPGKNKT